MEYDELCHYGVPGMKWGVRKAKALASKIEGKVRKRHGEKMAAKFKKANDKRMAKTKAREDKGKVKRKDLKSMSDAEINDRIKRLELERKYNEAVKNAKPQTSRGKKFAMDVVENSGRNIATQAVTYGLGVAVNKYIGTKIGDPNMVNPKKGQKDK